MTVQTKHFIELSDVLSLRFDCKHCGASLSLSLDDRLYGTIASCPGCHQPWTVLNGSSYEKLFADFSTLVKRLRMDTDTSIPLGCSMLLEIKQPKE